MRPSLRVLTSCFLLLGSISARPQTQKGELELRAAATEKRRCPAGPNADSLCNENTDCPGSACPDRDFLNLSVAVLFPADSGQLDTIKNAISAGSAMLFDVTDGQGQIGDATIQNNAFGTASADMRVYPTTNSQRWHSDTGQWRVGGSIYVSINKIKGSVGEAFAHEFLHLGFDLRDEYQRRPDCDITTISGDTCPVAVTISLGQAACLMDDPRSGISELCWGKGNPADAADLRLGNHDADNSTEQSQCRSNRSCWAQVVWSWPNTIEKPAAAPDAAAHGAVATAPRFLVVENTSRGVLVLDESASMGTESLMQSLKVGARDFLDVAETGTQLGLVSFAANASTSSGRSRVTIRSINTNRSTLTNEVDSLLPATSANVVSGLQAARDLVKAAGGVTGNTYVVLMTAGRHDSAANLRREIDDLRAAGIKVYVTCTGNDTMLKSQCSEIATRTRGLYVDSPSAPDLPESFVQIAALTSGHELIGSRSSSRFTLRKQASRWRFRTNEARDLASRFFGSDLAPDREKLAYFVEEGAEQALFTLQWKERTAQVTAILLSPSGAKHDMLAMSKGLFRRIEKPEPGNWTIDILSSPGMSDFTARAYSRNRALNVAFGVRHASVRPGEDLYVYAYPHAGGRALTTQEGLPMLVVRPDNSVDMVLIHDGGRSRFGGGDDVPGDGVFTGIYSDTQLKGAYQFISIWNIDGWAEAPDARPHHDEDENGEDHAFRSPRFSREVQVSATVADPDDLKR